VSAERTRRLAAVLTVLAVLAAVVTAFAVGMTTDPDGGGWGFVAIAGVAALAFGAGAVALLRRLDD
jgi:peptidoglycan/LPS O-acetylase OafA/YrhL